MIIYGASGHAKVIIDIIESMDGESVDFILDDDSSIKKLKGFPVQHQFNEAMNTQKVVIAIGNNLIRRKLSNSIANSFCKALVHNSVVISDDVKIQEGSVVMPKAIINSSVKIGKHCIVNTGAIIEHDSTIGDFAHISPGAVITGNVEIGEGTQIGAGSTVIPGTKIGKWVIIGAGAVIINDIPDFAVVVGNPGRIIKFNQLENE